MNRNRRTIGEDKAGFPGTGGDFSPTDQADEPDVEGHGGPSEPLHRRPPVTGDTGEGVVRDEQLGPRDAEDGI